MRLKKLPSDVVVVRDFVSIVGSTAAGKAKEDSDIDILIRSKLQEDMLDVQVENVFLPVRKVLDPNKDGNLHWIFNPQGYHADAIPLYDLVLRKKPSIERVTVKDFVRLDLGCGDNKAEGFVGIDKITEDGVDIVHDLDYGIPFPDNSASEIRAYHFLEHAKSPDYIMREIHRVLADGGILHFEVPSTKGEGAFADPTHSSFWNKSSFAFWSVPELLGNRPKFDVDWIEEEKISDEKVYVRGRLIARKDMQKDSSFKPFVSFIPPKAIAASYTDAFSGHDLWDRWASGKKFPFYVEPKYNSFRSIMEKSGSRVRVWFEDSKEDKAKRLRLYDKLKSIDADFILDCAVGIKRKGKWLSRIQLMTLTADVPKLEEGDKIVTVVFDLPYWNKDLHKQPFSERRKELEKFYSRFLKGSDAFEISPSHLCETKDEFLSKVKSVAKIDGSEGAVVKVAEGDYPLKGVMDSQGKIKNVLEIKAEVRGIQVNKNNTYSYRVGVLKGSTEYENVFEDKPNLINLGKTFSSKIKAEVGDIITVEVEEIIPQDKKLVFLGPKVVDVDRTRKEPYTAIQIIDMASRSSVLQKQEEGDTRTAASAAYWKNHWQECFPKSGKGHYTYQHHWRGLSENESKLSEDALLKTDHSVHGDLRLETDSESLWGFSVFLGKTSDVAGGRDLYSLKQDDKLQGAPKLKIPHGWLTAARKAPHVSKPGGPGSTISSWSKFFEVDHGTYDVGVWREHSFEVFLHGNKFKGRLVIQYAPVGGHRAWLLSMPSDQKPFAARHEKDKIISELRGKGQQYLVWASPGEKPDLIQVTKKIRFFKENKKKQIVYGVVLEPDQVDLQGEYVNAEDIENAAHDYFIESRKTKLSHTKPVNAKAVESYIVPVSFKFNDQLIKEGSWIVAMKIYDKEVWNQIENDHIVGFSIGGTKSFL